MILQGRLNNVSFTLRWEESFGASGYRIELGTTPGARDLFVARNGASTERLIRGIRAGVTKVYVTITTLGANARTSTSEFSVE